MAREIASAGDEVSQHPRLFQLALHLDAFFIDAGVAAQREQRVWSEGHEAGHRCATCDVLDVWIESAILVDDEHARQAPGGVGRPHQIGARRAVSVGRRIFHILALNASVVSADLGLRFRILGAERFKDPDRG